MYQNSRGQDPEEWERLKKAPITKEILHPEPEPVTPCPLEELDGLLSHLSANADVKEQTAFARGTLVPDGRLDLCKQVVGPKGIEPLMDALLGNDHVKTLLLGNNIVGVGGGKALGKAIADPRSKLTTWYIAGNHLDAAGIAPVCDAMANNRQVHALWLKRNPLRPQGTKLVAEMLEKNTYLQVLDLVNCGILDEGVGHLVKGGAFSHCSLRHLYLNSNGITEVGARSIATALSHNNKEGLISLFLACNRLGDEGALIIAEVLRVNKRLTRLSLASNHIGPVGVKAVADALSQSPLELLDLGFARSTTAVGAVGNRMTNEGAFILAKALCTNTTLKSLHVLHNSIGRPGIQALTDSLKQNKTLTALNVTQYGFSVPVTTLEIIRASLDRNKALFISQGGTEEQITEVELPKHIQEIYSVYRTKFD